MNWTMNLIIGNGISFIAGIFIILSMWVNDPKKAYKYQFLNAFILAISSIFFFSWTGVTTMAIAALRNALVYKDKLTLPLAIVFCIVAVALGFIINNYGLIGWLPIIAILEITICNYCLKSIKPIKISFIVNSAIYIIYFVAIFDYVSTVVETITALIGVISLIRLILMEKRELKEIKNE